MRKSEKQYIQRSSFIRLLGGIIVFFLVLPSLLHAHDLKNGIKEFREPPPLLHTALGEAESFSDKGQFHKAQAKLETYASAHPAETHPLLYYELGYFAYKAGNINAAISNLKKTVEIAPEFKDAWQLLSLAWQESGSAYSKEDKQEKTKRIYAMQSSAMAMDKAYVFSKDDDLLYQCAMLWLEAEKPKTALSILEDLSKRKAPKEEWLVGLSEALKALKNSEKTAEAMEKAARVGNNPELLFHAAYLWNELDKPKRALPLLKILAEQKDPGKNCFLLMAAVYNTLDQHANAAMAFERVIEIDPAPDYLYNCGVLWLQAEQPDKALQNLLRLADIQPLKADWLVAMAQAWLIKENIAKAADAMEEAASISKKSQHMYQAGTLRLQLKQVDRAINLLSPLAERKQPRKEWLVALANAWLLKENYAKGATYIEWAANISGEGKLYHQAGMLWLVEGKQEKSIKLLKKSVVGKKVEQLWLVDLASVLLAANQESEVKSVMERTNLADDKVSNQLRYRGVVIWLELQEPKSAYPLLKILVGADEPRYSWMSSLVKNCVELGKEKEAEQVLDKILSRYPSQVKSWKLAVWFTLQKGDYIAAVAAKEIVFHFEFDEKKHLNDLSRLYLLAGVPQQSAHVYRRTIGKKPTIEQLNHLVDIYQSGSMYEDALKIACEVAEQTKTAESLEVLGDIYYALHRYEASCLAYEQAAESCDAVNTGILMKAAYSAMKEKQYARAAGNFESVIASGIGEENQIQAAMQNLAYIKKKHQQDSNSCYGCD
ncbi:tetratricopeptide repeat protein [Desulfogranum japonicum]|uniref:tetratricopeptide repeat protein n=1 Tax=Desulfogranum japonicum TaxID=231447 RepID=UPI000413841B|nr:tetratricopeptide repeat protein [Desulfogranum japonicum]